MKVTPDCDCFKLSWSYKIRGVGQRIRGDATRKYVEGSRSPHILLERRVWVRPLKDAHYEVGHSHRLCCLVIMTGSRTESGSKCAFPPSPAATAPLRIFIWRFCDTSVCQRQSSDSRHTHTDTHNVATSMSWLYCVAARVKRASSWPEAR